MRTYVTALLISSALSSLGIVGTIADDAISTVDFDAYVGVVSDYRDRGLSLSDKDPTIVGSVVGYHDSGFYAGVKGAWIADRRGNDAQAKFFTGYSFDKDAYTYDVFVDVDTIHGDGDSKFYPSVGASVARDFGLLYFRTGLSYSFDGRWFTPENDSLYGFFDLEVPIPNMPEITVLTHVGYDNRVGRSDLMDWGVGLSAFVDQFELTVMYEDSSVNHPLGSGSVMFGIRTYF
ncbi:hypothetical protein GCM10017044_14870 [Kordiimonas sediminis]|uniref:Outer membrane protein beta-barrel domain-containing protein n=1 Tax=Kordiimonas sediminis TaxID=1735581 RepID=A0A919ARG8_9PROT|nr:TorF family putative porin [Kordiimonas sediminis]GHF20974.1 hypothetical protein GCM10017044_14870 [Kordiimonas sediminis]